MTYRLEAEQLVTIREAIFDIYGESHIDTAFVTGSIGAGKARPDSDVDIFFSYNSSVENPTEKRRAFEDFYFDLHAQLGREPDPISPGEALASTDLSDAITDISTVSPDRVLYNRTHFDAICWAGMLVSKKEVLVPSTPNLIALEKVSRTIVQRWASEFEPHTHITYGTGEDSDADKILRHTISSPGYYDAH
jgi:predicted nucleotidyltransferase